MVMQILVTYFLWWAIFQGHNELFGYSQSQILTYILFTSLARTIVMATRTQEVAMIINNGDLSNLLIRPVGFLGYAISRDIADKSLNIIFSIFEVSMLIFLLHPTIYIQTNVFILSLTLLSLFLGGTLFFYFSLLLSYIGFWTQDIWSPRFLSFIFIEFFAGMLFPLDIMPQLLFKLTQSLPFYYFIYFPIKVYLGQLSMLAIAQGFFIGIVWFGVFWYVSSVIWKKGLRVYTAEGK